MKKIITVLLFSFIAACCNTRAKVLSETDELILQSGCPENGVCGITVNRGKAIESSTDEYGNLNYVLTDNQAKSVFIITYNRNVPEGVQDGTYREELIFEVDNSNKSAVMRGEALQNVRLLFGRFCYCKGQTGYYKINSGALSISGDKKQRVFSLDFSASKTPQVLSSLKFVEKN